MNKEEYQGYLKSDHWKELRKEKRNRVSKKKGKVRCAVCAATESIETHHLFYRNIYDVQTSDLRMLCKTCHKTVHDLIKDGTLQLKKYKSHHAMFGALKELVKKRLGLTGRNMFRERQ